MADAFFLIIATELQARVQASDSEQAAWSSSLRMRLGRPGGKASSVPPSPHAVGSELTLSLPRLGFCHSSGQPKSPVYDTRSLTLKWSLFEGLARPAPSTRRTCQSVDICNGSLCRPQRRPPKKSQALCSWPASPEAPRLFSVSWVTAVRLRVHRWGLTWQLTAHLSSQSATCPPASETQSVLCPTAPLNAAPTLDNCP